MEGFKKKFSDKLGSLKDMVKTKRKEDRDKFEDVYMENLENERNEAHNIPKQQQQNGKGGNDALMSIECKNSGNKCL